MAAAKRKTIHDKIKELQAKAAVLEKKQQLKMQIENAKKELRSLKK